MASTRERLIAVGRRGRMAGVLCALFLTSCFEVEPTLTLSTDELDFGSEQTVLRLTIQNTSHDKTLSSGVTPLTYSVSVDRAWLAVDPSAGECGEGEFITHQVVIDRSMLAVGDNAGVIMVKSNSGNRTIAVNVYNDVPVCTTAPGAPSNPTPANDATDMPTDVSLAWDAGESTCPGLTATYDVYFGTANPPPLAEALVTSREWQPAALSDDETYYWQIVAKDDNGETAGPVWTITTAEAPCTLPPAAVTGTAPPDGAIDQSTTPLLSWTGGESQCDGLTATYDLYFGINNPPAFLQSMGSATQHRIYSLLDNVTYHWRVVAKDANGETSSPVYTFTTKRAACTLDPEPVYVWAPVNGAVDVPLDHDLYWYGGKSRCNWLVATFDVYFGTTNPPPKKANVGTANEWDPGTMVQNTKYYWRVEARDSDGGASWAGGSFTTVCLVGPSTVNLSEPLDMATDVPIDYQLSWSGGESRCAGLTHVYDVYFGTEPSPPLVQSDHASQAFSPGPLQYGTQYYWRIVARDPNGLVSSLQRTFTTAAAPMQTGSASE